MFRASSVGATLAIFALAAGCGDEEGEEEVGQDVAASSPCGPNGTLHVGPGVDPHCDCNDGYTVENGICVPRQSSPVVDQAPNCGPNGRFDGTSCSCDQGYTQTGLEADRRCERIPECQAPNDGFEPNDVPSQAVPWSEVSGSLYACPADADWYIFPVTAGDTVSVELTFSGASVDLDLLLYGPSSRNYRAFSVSAGGNREAASFVARADGTAGVWVMPYGTGEGAYDLRIDVQEGEPPMCVGPGAFCRQPADCCSNICHVGHCH